MAVVNKLITENNSSNKSSNYNDFFEELKIGIDTLSKFFAEYKNKDNIEIELRIGQIQHDGFKPGLGTKDFYNKIKNTPFRMFLAILFKGIVVYDHKKKKKEKNKALLLF